MGIAALVVATFVVLAYTCFRHRFLFEGSMQQGRTTNFFPPGALDRRPDGHEFRERWYVSHLLAMQERPLRPPAKDQPRVYRLLYLPTFDQPSVVRVTDRGGIWKAVFRRTDGRGGYSPGQLTVEKERTLSPAEVEQLGHLLYRAAFWEMSSFDDSDGLDGSEAVLEAAVAGRYHVVDRWSPTGTPYAALVQFFLGLGGWVPE